MTPKLWERPAFHVLSKDGEDKLNPQGPASQALAQALDIQRGQHWFRELSKNMHRPQPGDSLGGHWTGIPSLQGDIRVTTRWTPSVLFPTHPDGPCWAFQASQVQRQGDKGRAL